ncbi:hypothetical protein OKW24_001460 [Peribacillus simplex]|nr:hypothetical protein [Peribacillus simplex]
MKKAFEKAQQFGKSFMLPIAVCQRPVYCWELAALFLIQIQSPKIWINPFYILIKATPPQRPYNYSLTESHFRCSSYKNCTSNC